jgi:hypothetical protein
MKTPGIIIRKVINFKVSFIFTDKKSDFTILKVTNV